MFVNVNTKEDLNRIAFMSLVTFYEFSIPC